MPMTTSIDPRLFDIRIKEAVLEGINTDPVYKDIIDEVDHMSVSNDKQAVRTMDFNSLGPPQEKGETTPIPFDQMARGYLHITTPTEYGLAVGFSKKLWDDDQTGLMQRGGQELGKTFPLLYNLKAAELYDNAHNTTYYAGPDAVALLSTAHTSTMNSGSRANKLSTSAALSYNSLQELLIVGMRQTNMRGYPDPAWKKGDTITLIVQPEDQFTAYKIVGGDALSKGQPDTENTNNVNVFKQFNWNVVVNNYMQGTGTTSARLWFLQRSNDKGIQLVHRVKPSQRQHIDESTLALVYTVYARFHQRINHWHSTYGSGD